MARITKEGVDTVGRIGLYVNRETGPVQLMQLTDNKWTVCAEADSLPLSDFPALEASTIRGVVLA